MIYLKYLALSLAFACLLMAGRLWVVSRRNKRVAERRSLPSHYSFVEYQDFQQEFRKAEQ